MVSTNLLIGSGFFLICSIILLYKLVKDQNETYINTGRGYKRGETLEDVKRDEE